MRLLEEQVAWMWIAYMSLVKGLVKDRLLGCVGEVLQWGLSQGIALGWILIQLQNGNIIERINSHLNKYWGDIQRNNHIKEYSWTYFIHNPVLSNLYFYINCCISWQNIIKNMLIKPYLYIIFLYVIHCYMY